MKNNIYLKFILVKTALVYSFFLGFSQPYSWIQKNNFPGSNRYSTCYFTIGTKGYLAVGLGGSPSSGAKNDLWEYDPTLDSWTQKANFTGSARWSSRGMSDGTNGYLWGGASVGYPSDLYKYSPGTNSWILISSNCPITGRQDATSFTIDGKSYITCGYGGNYKSDLWEYSPVNNTWTQKANFMGGARDGAASFVINNEGYVGFGIASGATLKKDFYKYNPITNIWSSIASFPGVIRHSAVGFSIGNTGYAGAGSDYLHSTFYTDFYSYSSSTNSWTLAPSFLPNGISYPFIFDFDSVAYAGAGWDNISNYTNKVYKFGPLSTSFENVSQPDFHINVYPNPFIDVIKLQNLHSFNVKKIELIDNQGKLINSFDITEKKNEWQISNLSEIKKGTYILRFYTPQTIYLKTVIKN